LLPEVSYIFIMNVAHLLWK